MMALIMCYDQAAVDAYGWIFDTKTWDDVTVGGNLLTKAAAELASRINLSVSLDVSAIDLSMTDDQIDKFRFFEYVKVNSPAHQLNDFMLIQKLTIDMDNPQNNKLTLGTELRNLLGKSAEYRKSDRKRIEQPQRNEHENSKLCHGSSHHAEFEYRAICISDSNGRIRDLHIQIRIGAVQT